VSKKITVQHNVPADAKPVPDLLSIHEKHEQRVAALAQEESGSLFGQPEQQGLFSMPQVEKCKELTIQLPDGRQVELAIPPVATHLVCAQIMGKDEGINPVVYASTLATIKGVMHVKSINGVEVRRPVNKVELQELMNKLGEQGVECVATAYQLYLSAPSPHELVILKKS